ncbi:MAG: ATP-dependent DNA helicase [Gemmatimonadetes bacterium 13_1_20CM_4_66_11]|nr:MAG: ATP-dependent DNA helicase [Gemmatimonadetes bacterium 13_1_40CM_3_66_12]OLD89396.1 MAG: ATP-dependent DNA helicase [Gemmatimonadetes bacterium 13_1_20CM_4_66_11]
MLNASQLAAATAPPSPLLIIAGAGTGKTNTLAHRVAHLITAGADPGRILLLTFTRRAAEIMTRRAERIVGKKTRMSWSGTFHSIANRLLRLHANTVGLDPSFTVLDRSDSADLLNVVRNDLGFARLPARFPRKDTCLAIYSHVVNTRGAIETTLKQSFPAYADWVEQLKALFLGYVEAKQTRALLDYDDLLLYWFYLDGELIRRRFDHVLVDEYQDTNSLQAEIVLKLGTSITVVGDDAQAIYAFRGATVRNILDFPSHFDPPATVIKLEQNYRSTQPILAASNAVIGLAAESYRKNLFSERRSEQQPLLVAAKDEQAQADYIVERVLEQREAGILLHHQAVLMRAAHHSDLLEIELGKRNIPFVKYGGLKFLEAAHVKDVLCILRWAENARDDLAGFRVLQLLPGIGPAHARRMLDGGTVPPGLAELLDALRHATQWPGQLGMVRKWYEPHLERLYEGASVRIGDLETLESLARNHQSRESFLSDLTLDPPEALGDLAGDPLIDEDYLILSTIHSAKGQEWDVVYILNVVDGCIPSDMATGSKEEIEEERRLLYVAMTRARDHLYLIQPHRFYTGTSRRNGDRHVYAPRTRFLPDAVLESFERVAAGGGEKEAAAEGGNNGAGVNVAAKLREMWS